MTVTTKSNPDYSNSAVNLCNPPAIGFKLMDLQDVQARWRTLDANLQAMPEYQELQEQAAKVAGLTDAIKAMVEVQGSYQDQENGFYAVKQRKLSKQYNATLFEEFFPEYAQAVIKKTVDTVKLNGLVKGGLLSEEGLKRSQVMTEAESFAFIIR